MLGQELSRGNQWRNIPLWYVANVNKNSRNDEILSQLEPEDLLKYGLIPEFIGRLPVVATLHDLEVDHRIDRYRDVVSGDHVLHFDHGGRVVNDVSSGFFHSCETDLRQLTVDKLNAVC